MEESFEEVVVVFVADGQAAEVEEPGDRAFDFITALVAPQRAAVLQGRFLASPAVGTDQLDPARIHLLANPIGVHGPVVEHSFRFAFRHSDVDERLQRVHLCVVRRRGERRERRAVAVDEQHDLRAFAFLGVADLGAPFFPGENVPSPIPSSQSICFKWSSFPSSRRQAVTQIPACVHSCRRRQHVAGLGYRSGKSFHRAPVWSTHNTPSKQARGGTLGRPPLEVIGGWGNRSAINFHWESSKNGGGTVLEPVLLGRRRGGHIDRVMTMCCSPFTTHGMQLARQNIKK